MGSYIVRFDGPNGPRYCEWSTIVDAPVTRGMTFGELHEYIAEQYGSTGSLAMPGRMARVAQKGTSAMNHDSLVSCVWLNRAGPDESRLSLQGLRALVLDHATKDELRKYVVPEPDEDDGNALWIAWCKASNVDPETEEERS